MTTGNGNGDRARDIRRRFTEADRRLIHSDQDGLCANCGEPLPDNFDVHHLVPWHVGGPTVPSNALGLCRDCHLVIKPLEFTGVEPRDWQVAALEAVLPWLRRHLTSTIAAAPGAGKTLFAGMVTEALMTSGTIDRVVVLVPNNSVRMQWSETFARMHLQLDDRGRYTVENPDAFHGVVHTYQRLVKDPLTVRELATRAERLATLYVLDEVHHLGESDYSQWGQLVGTLTGTDPEHPKHPVLNLSGTMFRSSRRQRIATVRYEPVVDDNDKIQAVIDYDIPSSRLIAANQLRHVSLFQFETELEIVYLQTAEVTTGGIADLSDQAPAVRSEALRKMLNDDTFLRGILREMTVRMDEHAELLEGHPIKALVVCEDQTHARRVKKIVDELLPIPAYFAISDDGREADVNITRFRNTRKPAVLVSVRKVTEGFDCADVTTLVHLTTWRAQLFINQMIARAMRVTDTERRLGYSIPCAVLIPNDSHIIGAYNNVLVDTMHILELPDVCSYCGQIVCICFDCRRCRQSPCICIKEPPPEWQPQLELSVVGAPELVGVAHDGTQLDWSTFGVLTEALSRAGVPSSWHPGVVAVLQDPTVPKPRATDDPRTRPATTAEQIAALSARRARAAGWWKRAGDCDVAIFQARINDHMGIVSVSENPSLEQWRSGVNYALAEVRKCCSRHGIPVPNFAKGDMR